MSESSKNFFFAWVPDCDGDRGNIVINDPVRGIIYPDAQSTFMLSVLSELAFVKIFFPGRFKKICVTVNDATSLRIEKIAGFFNIPVFTAETGEANVLGLARIKNQHGYIVRMAGEGSNGGNITFPGLVRDPLSTVMSLLKLIFLSGRGTSLFAAAAACFNIDPLLPFNERLAAIIAACPFHTTSAFESEALLKVRIKKYPVFKALYEKHLRERFPEFAGQNRLFKKYEIYNYEGARERKGQGNRSGDESGGLRVILYGDQSQKKGFLWMRGSRTEPVLRLMADIEGSRKNHDELLSFHRRLIEKSLMKQS
ncbi:MAG TPA: hypothetical protein DC049_14985 [Spirochaetia bacterium]|nr:hypothetical protein [Spirochaetia bacterium]